ncbi:MAG: type II toxin-antitoxin system RelE/ParE family toxin [Candidatus Sumerlaeia bacterium]|nr:type II toxin-antitoxin system RelE/ParE family toxin [Candidatus Sumerlaeia bacterium]
MARILYKPQAVVDIENHALWLVFEVSQGISKKFLDSLDATVLDLSEMPMVGRLYQSSNPRLMGIRVWRVAEFENILLIYRPIKGGIELFRVLHGARDIPKLLGDQEWY